jgi:5-hydroxyisourate hydrolase
MSFVSAHVLDASVGVPAAGIKISLHDDAGNALGVAHTDADGRVGELGPLALSPGHYRVVFATGAYFAGRGQDCFHPVVEIHFTVAEGQPHYHIPLLLSPFAYTTYRGS